MLSIFLLGIPNIRIVFPNGHEDTLVLERHYASPEHRMTGELHCNFIGHLKNEKEACAAVTGCYGSEDMEFTINSKHNTMTNMYILEKNGNLKSVESAFKHGERMSRSIRPDGKSTDGSFEQVGDEMVNMQALTNQMGMEKLCNSGDCSTIPDKNLMKIKVCIAFLPVSTFFLNPIL